MGKPTIHVDKYALPTTVDGICALMREILAGGGVKRLELDTDDAFVRAHRWKDVLELEEDAITLDGALRNVLTLQEYYSEGATSFQVVVDMMLLAQEEALLGVCWATGVGGPEFLRTWFGIDQRKLPVGSVDKLLGLPVHRLKSLPEETLVLCCSKYASDDPSDITMGIKTTIELRRDYESSSLEDADRSGGHTQEHTPATCQLVPTARGLHRVLWKP